MTPASLGINAQVRWTLLPVSPSKRSVLESRRRRFNN